MSILFLIINCRSVFFKLNCNTPYLTSYYVAPNNKFSYLLRTIPLLPSDFTQSQLKSTYPTQRYSHFLYLSFFISFYLTPAPPLNPPHPPHLTSPHLNSPQRTSPQRTSTHLTSPHLTLPHPISLHSFDPQKGFHRIWNIDMQSLGEMPLPNILERMKKKV